MGIEGIIYDLDGTLIATQHLHDEAWRYAASKFQVTLASQISRQRGLTTDQAARILLPPHKQYLQREFVRAKEQYVVINLRSIALHAGAEEVLEQLERREKKVWICTSADHDFVQRVFALVPTLARMQERTVFREMYAQGKPAPDPLLITLQGMGLAPVEAVYVGDAFADYQAARSAGTGFVHFAREEDQRIPASISRIRDHRQLLEVL